MSNVRLNSVEKDDAVSLARKFTITGPFTLPSTSYRGTQVVRQDDDTTMLCALPAHSTYHVGFRYEFEALPTQTRWIARKMSGSTVHLQLGMNTSGQWVVANGSGTELWGGSTLMQPNIPYYCEWSSFIDNSSGTTAVYVNGSPTPDATAFTGDTQSGATATINVWSWGRTGQAGTSYFSWHDCYWNSGAGSSPNNTRWGETSVRGYLANADGYHSGLTALGGGAQYLEIADATVDDDLSYLFAAGAARSTVKFPGLGFTALDVRSACLWQTARRTDAVGRTLDAAIRSAGADYNVGAQSPTTTYLDYCYVQETDPATAAQWTQIGLEAAEWGPLVA